MCMYIYIYIYVYMYVCMYVYVCMHVYVYVYIYSPLLPDLDKLFADLMLCIILHCLFYYRCYYFV